MTITYDDEPTSPQIEYEERRKPAASQRDVRRTEKPLPEVDMSKYRTPLPFMLPVMAQKAGLEAWDKLAYKLGGKATDVATNLGASPEVAAGLGLTANVATQAVPAFIGGGAAKTVAAPAMQEAGRGLMQSALKPSLEALRTGKAAKAIDTMLKGGFNATPGGVAAMKAQIASLNDDIVKAIANSPATVDKNAVASRLMDSVKKFSMQVNPKSDVAAIEKAWTEFLSHPLLTGRAQIPVQTAQQLKQGTYKALGSRAYGELKGAEIEAQKTLARGLKEEISAAVPAVAKLNAEETALLNAAKIAERRTLMAGNNNPIPLPASLAAAVKNPGVFMALLANSSPWAKSMLARGLFSGSEALPYAGGASLGALLGAESGSPEGALEAIQRKYRAQ